MIDLPSIRRRLSGHQGETVTPGRHTRQAAVAVILREAAGQTHILFIKRADKAGDPWSGQMAFPGGHRESADADLKAAAIRETREEIGLDLTDSEYLGALDHHYAAPRGPRMDMLIAPHVFVLEGERPLSLNYEVAEVVWAPLDALVANGLHDTETLPIAGTPTVFNGYRLTGGHFVWGLTYRMLKDFFLTLNPDWPPPAEVG